MTHIHRNRESRDTGIKLYKRFVLRKPGFDCLLIDEPDKVVIQRCVYDQVDNLLGAT